MRKKLTPEEGQAALAQKPKRSKYHVRVDAAGRAARTMPIDGKPVVFDSVGEMNRWCELKLLEKAGKIFRLNRQMPIGLATATCRVTCKKARSQGTYELKAVNWIVDFAYDEFETALPRHVWEDFKGAETDVYKLKLNLAIRQLPPGAILRISHADGTREDFSR